MGGTNYKKGAGFESRWLNTLLADGTAKRGARYFRSTGPKYVHDFERMNDKGTDYAWKYAPVDVWYVDKDGVFHEDQCKYGQDNVGRIDMDEMLDLIMYAWDKPDFVVSLVSKQKAKRKVHVWTFKNNTVGA